MNKTAFATMTLALLLGVAGCERSGPAERLGEDIDDAAEEMSDTIDDACEDVKEAAGAENDDC